jgi:tetratricopeptide (TPR) repeat protein
MQLGLPYWVVGGAVALLMIGLPIMLLTGHHERQRAIARTTGMQVATPAQGVQRLFTWRRAILGGGLAFVALTLVAGVYMGMRLMGIGPVGTLVASGVLESHERLILAEFDNATSDSTIGETVTELLRIDLAQSPVISVMEAGQVSDVLERMELGSDARLTAELAAEVAAREGIKAYIAGDIRPVGEGFIISARVIAAGSGEALVAARETADGAGELIGAVDRLSAHLRERIGESLRTVRSDPPLERVTTTSLEALRLYAQADRLSDEGDYDRAIALLEEAIERDSSFAMAYRRLGAYRGNRGEDELEKAALSRAYELRTRLSERERYHVEALYASSVELDEEGAVTALLALLEKYPTDGTALNNIAISYGLLGRPAERNAALRRAIDADVAPAISYTNLIAFLLWSADVEQADTLLARFAERFPESAQIPQYAAQVARARWDYDLAETKVREVLESSPGLQQWARFQLAELAQIHGRLNEARLQQRQALRVQAERFGYTSEDRQFRIDLADALLELRYADDPAALAERIASLWERNRVLTAQEDPEDRRYLAFANAFARAGLPDRASQLVEEYRSELTDVQREQFNTRLFLQFSDAEIAVAEGRPGEAASILKRACDQAGRVYASCAVAPTIAEAYDRAGEADSAAAYYERFANIQAERFGWDENWSTQARLRLGELYEAKGDTEKALEYYNQFVELWQDADPELQPIVRDVRQRMARLVGEG